MAMGNNLCKYNPNNTIIERNGADDDDGGTNQLSAEFDNRIVLIINCTHRCTDIFMDDFDCSCCGGGGVTAGPISLMLLLLLLLLEQFFFVFVFSDGTTKTVDVSDDDNDDA
jgi:hypothetical protein